MSRRLVGAITLFFQRLERLNTHPRKYVNAAVISSSRFMNESKTSIHAHVCFPPPQPTPKSYPNIYSHPTTHLSTNSSHHPSPIPHPSHHSFIPSISLPPPPPPPHKIQIPLTLPLPTQQLLPLSLQASKRHTYKAKVFLETWVSDPWGIHTMGCISRKYIFADRNG